MKLKGLEKLKADRLREIKRLRKDRYSAIYIAKKLGITRQRVYQILKGQ